MVFYKTLINYYLCNYNRRPLLRFSSVLGNEDRATQLSADFSHLREFFRQILSSPPIKSTLLKRSVYYIPFMLRTTYQVHMHLYQFNSFTMTLGQSSPIFCFIRCTATIWYGSMCIPILFNTFNTVSSSFASFRVGMPIISMFSRCPHCDSNAISRSMTHSESYTSSISRFIVLTLFISLLFSACAFNMAKFNSRVFIRVHIGSDSYAASSFT